MSSRSGLRRTAGVLLAALLALSIACAEKTLAPRAPGSPRFTLQVSTLGRASLVAQQLVIAAVYFSSVVNSDGDSVRVLDIQSAVSSGGAQSLTLKVDLTGCLADPTRRGSQSACSMYIGAFLEPATFDVDTGGSIFGKAFDFQLVGPFDASPGQPPVIPTIDLSTSRFAVNEWQADEALRVGGEQTPYGLNGVISGVSGSNPGDPPTLFALELGSANTSTNPNAPTFQLVGQLVIYQNGKWRRVDGPPSASSFLSVAGFAANDVYVGGSNGLYHYDGSAITQVFATPVGVSSVAVIGSPASTKLVIAGSQGGVVWVGSGTSFTRYTTPLGTVTGGGQVIDGVCINSPTEAFASTRTGGNLLRFDGTNWTSVPATLTAGKADLQCLGPNQAYVTNQGSGNLLKWNGTGWTSLPVPSGISGRSLNFGVVSANEIYAVGDSGNTNRAYYRYDGSTWREIARTSFNGFYLQHPWVDPNGGAVYVGSSPNQGMRIDKVTSAGTSVVSYMPALRGVSMPGTTTAFVVGGNYFLARWNGSRWSVDTPPAGTQTNLTLEGVWSDGASNAWAVGQSSAIAHWDGTRWTVVSDARRPAAFPADNYNAAWSAGGNVFIAGDASIIRCKPSSPAAGAVISCAADGVAAQGPFYAIWGTSATNAFAVGANGHIVHFDGSSWSAMTSPTTGRLGAVGGTGPNDVWAVGDTAALHYDGTKWSPVTRTVLDNQFVGYQPNAGSFQTGLWVIDPTETYLGTIGSIRRGSSLSWDDMAGPFFGIDTFVGRVVGIAGVARGCALAVTDGQTAPGGAMLLRGVGQSGCLSSPMTPPASWP
ncbi:MAG: hypothetical protein ACREPM_22870 [Gemmatimonadaceae bacterium]